MVALSATPIHTERGGSSKRTNGIAACIARDRERQIQSNGCQHSSKRLTYCPHQTHTHPHPSHQSSSTAPSQPAVWPCQMTYDTQHLRPIGGGALSNTPIHTDGGGSSMHTNGIAACIARDRERQIQNTGCQHSSKRLTRCPHQTHTPIPPIQQHISTAPSQPAVWYR